MSDPILGRNFVGQDAEAVFFGNEVKPLGDLESEVALKAARAEVATRGYSLEAEVDESGRYYALDGEGKRTNIFYNPQGDTGKWVYVGKEARVGESTFKEALQGYLFDIAL